MSFFGSWFENKPIRCKKCNVEFPLYDVFICFECSIYICKSCKITTASSNVCSIKCKEDFYSKNKCEKCDNYSIHFRCYSCSIKLCTNHLIYCNECSSRRCESCYVTHKQVECKKCREFGIVTESCNCKNHQTYKGCQICGLVRDTVRKRIKCKECNRNETLVSFRVCVDHIDIKNITSIRELRKYKRFVKNHCISCKEYVCKSCEKDYYFHYKLCGTCYSSYNNLIEVIGVNLRFKVLLEYLFSC